MWTGLNGSESKPKQDSGITFFFNIGQHLVCSKYMQHKNCTEFCTKHATIFFRDWRDDWRPGLLFSMFWSEQPEQSSAHSLYGQIVSEWCFAQSHGFTGRGTWSYLPTKSCACCLEHEHQLTLTWTKKHYNIFPTYSTRAMTKTAIKSMQFLPPAPVGENQKKTPLPSFFIFLKCRFLYLVEVGG